MHGIVAHPWIITDATFFTSQTHVLCASQVPTNCILHTAHFPQCQNMNTHTRYFKNSYDASNRYPHLFDAQYSTKFTKQSMHWRQIQSLRWVFGTISHGRPRLRQRVTTRRAQRVDSTPTTPHPRHPQRQMHYALCHGSTDATRAPTFLPAIQHPSMYTTICRRPRPPSSPHNLQRPQPSRQIQYPHNCQHHAVPHELPCSRHGYTVMRPSPHSLSTHSPHHHRHALIHQHWTTTTNSAHLSYILPLEQPSRSTKSYKKTHYYASSGNRHLEKSLEILHKATMQQTRREQTQSWCSHMRKYGQYQRIGPSLTPQSSLIFGRKRKTPTEFD